MQHQSKAETAGILCTGAAAAPASRPDTGRIATSTAPWQGRADARLRAEQRLLHQTVQRARSTTDTGAPGIGIYVIVLPAAPLRIGIELCRSASISRTVARTSMTSNRWSTLLCGYRELQLPSGRGKAKLSARDVHDSALLRAKVPTLPPTSVFASKPHLADRRFRQDQELTVSVPDRQSIGVPCLPGFNSARRIRRLDESCIAAGCCRRAHPTRRGFPLATCSCIVAFHWTKPTWFTTEPCVAAQRGPCSVPQCPV